MGRRFSIPLKFFGVFILTMLLVAGSFMATLNSLRKQVSRNEAHAIADQVLAFRSWIAQSGMVWVQKMAPGFHDFLDEQSSTSGTTFYGKNPAMATRELSFIMTRESARSTFRVTSDKYRKEENAPDAFESAAIARFQTDKALEFVEKYEEGKYRYAQPLFVEQNCLQCHGDPKDAPQTVITKYGKEKAFGYKIGQVRGVISVTVPAVGLRDVLKSLANPYSIALLVISLILNILFIRSVVMRLVELTRNAEAIAAGKLETVLLYTNPSESNDELDHLYHAVNLLKRSLVILFKRINNHGGK
ncbi:c-type heme family protein [Candidatus Electronema sp. PJ]|uniref:Tll0287-like domain-containing protein n=1 Tax=Candidatus Electronema sp. PJ TaxID=3401572 RepID=UPI003AA96273